MINTDLGIDLGSSTVTVYRSGKGVVLQEPAIVAYDQDAGQVKAVGDEASVLLKEMAGNYLCICPLRTGIVSDYDVMEKMLKYFMQKAMGTTMFSRKPGICVTVPSCVSELSKEAVENVAYQAGARDIIVIDEPVASAIGAGIDITKTLANLILDIGAGFTNIAVVVNGSAVISHSVPVAGNTFDRIIREYIYATHGLLISEKQAEEIKCRVGTAYRRIENPVMEVIGRDAANDVSRTVSVDSKEIARIMKEPVEQILQAMAAVLSQLTVELARDIVNRGIVLTGGSASLDGLEKAIVDRFGINTMTADQPSRTAAVGAGKYMEVMKNMERRI